MSEAATTLADLSKMARPRLSAGPLPEPPAVRCDEASLSFSHPPGTLEAAKAAGMDVRDEPACARGLRLRYAWYQAHTWLVANNPDVMAADALSPAVITARATLDAHVEICEVCRRDLDGVSVETTVE